MAQPWWPPSTGIWDWGHPVVTVTAGCTSILDRNWKTKYSHLIGGKLVFRLEASLSCGGTSVPVLARQSSFQLDNDGDLHEQILHTEAHIEELTDIIERCRKIILISKAAIAAGGTLILANNHRSGRVRSYGLHWVACGGYRRDGRFWVKREHFEANYDRHESCRGTQNRVDRPNGSSSSGRRGGREHVKNQNNTAAWSLTPGWAHRSRPHATPPCGASSTYPAVA